MQGAVSVAIEIVWEDEAHTIMRHIYHRGWTSEEYDAMNQQSHDAIVALGHPVYLITDFRDSAQLPSNTMAKRQKVQRMIPANLALNIIVGADPLAVAVVKTMLNVSKAFTRERNKDIVILFADTLEEAHAMIESQKKQSQ
jgi:hypothetical protein